MTDAPADLIARLLDPWLKDGRKPIEQIAHMDRLCAEAADALAAQQELERDNEFLRDNLKWSRQASSNAVVNMNFAVERANAAEAALTQARKSAFEVTDELVENGAAGMYGKNWNSPDDQKRPGEKMKEVWRKYARDCLAGARADRP